ncbi:MAG: dihydrofolate reductase [Mycoplasmataceae bacterium]|nr:dihydrofolate reductase [Mycoplasmataceae bacterium]
MIKLIVAYDKNRLIGKGDKLVWEIKEDLKHFKKETENQTILFGDITFTGIGKPLPNRKTIILTLDKSFKYNHKDVTIEYDINNIINTYKNNNDKNIIIAGGATIYKLFLPFVDEMIISHIQSEYEGDKYFPKWNTKDFFVEFEEKHNGFIVKKYKRK